MDELLTLKTQDWDLTVWASGVDKRRDQLSRVFAKREPSEPCVSRLRFSPEINVIECQLLGKVEASLLGPFESFALCSAIFFENTQYQFEWVFNGTVSAANINHKLSRIAENFKFTNSRGVPGLFGSINTANDVGWLRLPLVYLDDVGERHINMSVEVLPTKILMHQDIPVMHAAIDEDYPLWRFSANSAAEQEASSSGVRERFALMWLAQFEQLRGAFEKGLKVIANAPHSRLVSDKNYKTADKIKGRISPKLTEKIRQDVQAKQFDKRYLVERKVLSVDTPENRFVKHIVTQAKRVLEQLHNKLVASNKNPEADVFTEDYLKQVKGWQQPLQKMLSQPFIQEVGAYKDVNKVSLVLQQKTGYSSVYRIWQDLKLYLDLFDQQAFVGVRTIAQIYEVWCFLALRNLLRDDLGFEIVDGSRAGLIEDGLEFNFIKNAKSCFILERNDGVKLKLWHEPTYSTKSDPLRVFTEKQRPDIVLEATFADGTQAYWLFDAKYRIDADRKTNVDFVPEDAINQMHRYRDAIIYTKNNDNHDSVQKSRPVAGAFALYPGYFENQSSHKNPYERGINEVGIGAFALLPSEGGANARWLRNYLIQQLGDKPKDQRSGSKSYKGDTIYIREASRIPYHGMRQVRYSELVMTARLGNKRSLEYIQAFRAGTARIYHIPVSTFKTRFDAVLINEVAYLAIAAFDDGDVDAVISHVWPVISVKVLERHEVANLDAGGESQVKAEKYYVFELGQSMPLANPLVDVPSSGADRFRASMKLVELSHLFSCKSFSEIKSKYLESLQDLS